MVGAFLFIVAVPCFAGEEAVISTPSVLVHPFEIRGSEELGYLKDAIAGMLSTRLFAAGDLKAPETGDMDSAYTLNGSLTQLGEALSLDVVVSDVTGKEADRTFFESTQNMDGLIPALERLAVSIRRTLTGTEVVVTARTPETTEPVSEEAQAGKDNVVSEFFRAEKKSEEFWTSRKFKTELSGITGADVDG